MQQDLSHSKHIKFPNETINTHKLYNISVPDRSQHKVGKKIIVSLAYHSDVHHLGWKIHSFDYFDLLLVSTAADLRAN